MADHLRKQIRAAAATTLTGLTTTSTRVFTERARAMQAADLPGLRIYCDDESIEVASMGTGRYRKRTMSLVVEGIASGNTAPENTCDQIAKEVEIALDANNGLGGLVKWIEPRRINTDISKDADTLIAVVRMEFEVLYYAQMGAPDVAL